ncbi:MAG: DUF4338 domain-containing protein [Nitrospiraceae bacterium]|nr:DUF4338 domain-containing protein [Nitrospiraceae bacterium]
MNYGEIGNFVIILTRLRLAQAQRHPQGHELPRGSSAHGGRRSSRPAQKRGGSRAANLPWRIRYPELVLSRQKDARPAGEWPDLALRPVSKGFESELWNDLVHTWHYLGHKTLPGAQIRYIAWSGETPLACMGFGAAAWKTAPRDAFIGWSAEQQKQNLSLVVNNARFLILPWIQSRNLASMLLGMAARRLPDDWQERYHYAPVLLETFVEMDRFRGTCYMAANWISVGITQGRGKKDTFKQYALPPKEILLAPLRKDFRSILCSPPPR